MPFIAERIVPHRISLDTCAFQAVADCGGYVFGEDPCPGIEDFRSGEVPQVIRRPDGRDILDSLKAIFAFNHRANFDWIVAPSSLAEIDAAGDPSRSRYARDIIDHSDICLAEDPPSDAAKTMAELLAGPTFHKKISYKDRQLLVDAAAADCDHFLTIEKRLPKQAPVVLRHIPLVICSPMDFWKKLAPHIRGL
jgi:hypothetical protein